MTRGKQIEILRHSLGGIVDEMFKTLQRTAFSPNIKTRMDCTCGLFDKNLRNIAQHDIHPMHMGLLVEIVPTNIRDLDYELNPGDGILVNDPAKNHSHLPDVTVISPLYFEDRIEGYAATLAHHVDIGGKTPGGIPPDVTDNYQSGIIIPGIRAIENWEMNPEIFKFLLRNVRGADMRKGDYSAQIGANKVAEQRLQELLADQPVDEYEASVDALLDYTERLTRAGIDAIPDGVYPAEEYFDGDGVVDEPVKLAVTITVNGDEMTVDFTGTSEQNKGPLNITRGGLMAGLMVLLLAFIDKDIPKNEGYFRPIEVITPDGSMVNPDPHIPVAGWAEVKNRIGDIVTKAMVNAMPDKAIAGTKGSCQQWSIGGRNPEFLYYESFGGGFGARATKDGMEAVQSNTQNTKNASIEELEDHYPVLIRQYSLIADSEGPGRFRGGLGIRRDIEVLSEEATLTINSDRMRFPPWGIFGGKSARPAKYLVNDGVLPSSKITVEITKHDVAIIQTPGGGGYGPPHERNPEQVLDDVTNEKVSLERARSEYGVVIDESTWTVDTQATKRSRDQIAASPSEEGDDPWSPSVCELRDQAKALRGRDSGADW